MRCNIRMQPSDRQVPFNYLAIQNPEDTSVGKSSTFPWGRQKSRCAHQNFFFFFALKALLIPPFSFRTMLPTLSERGVGCPAVSVNQLNPFATTVRQILPSPLQSPLFSTAFYSSHTSSSVSQKTLTQTVAKINPLKRYLTILLLFFFFTEHILKKSRADLVTNVHIRAVIQLKGSNFQTKCLLKENVHCVFEGVYVTY